MSAIVLNYLALHGEQGSFNAMMPESNLGSTPAELDPLTAFQPLLRFRPIV